MVSDLKPQDSFGEVKKFSVDLQKVQEIIRKHRSDLPAIVLNDYCNAILPSGKLSLCTFYGKVFGGTPNIFMFWLFSENESISERIVNRALIQYS